MIKVSEIEENDFEKEVSKIATGLWPDPKGGSSIQLGKERDGIYLKDDVYYLIECTNSRSKHKAEKDIEKLVQLHKELRKLHTDKLFKAYFITRDEPTADQRTVANNSNFVTAISYEQFRNKLLNFSDYKNTRENYAFGSARDPKTGDFKVNDNFIQIELNDARDSKQKFNTDIISNNLLKGEKIVIQGHFGVGKSMTLKDVYKKLWKKYDNRESYCMPIYLNLRDHHGQINAVEAIERHLRNIGINETNNIVKAWRAGYIILILDGFDELAAYGWAGKSTTLKDIRFKTMELLRDFIKNTPRESGILIAGRSNYFDSIKELEKAFSLLTSNLVLNLGDFSHEQTQEYLKKKNITINLPNWIPTRPLLLGYLVTNGILNQIMEFDGIDIPAEGWNFLIDEVCKRESLIEAGLNFETIREIIEGVASHCRQFQNGNGPIFKQDLEDVFQKICGYPPDDRALVLLQRLPGLSAMDEQDGSKYFIDNYFLEVAKIGEIYRFVMDPYQYKLTSDPRKWNESISEIGIDLLSLKLADTAPGVIEDAIICAKKIEFDILTIDILMVLNNLNLSWKRENLTIKDSIIPSIDLKNTIDWSRITFSDIIFREIIIEEAPNLETSPKFLNCMVGKIIGCSNLVGIPSFIHENIVIDQFEELESTTSAILSSSLPKPVKIGLTILKKLYIQSGNGRQENAFYRGLTNNDQSYVKPVLESLRSNNMAIPSKKGASNNVWQPVKSQFGLVKNLIANKSIKHKILSDLEKISI